MEDDKNINICEYCIKDESHCMTRNRLVIGERLKSCKDFKEKDPKSGISFPKWKEETIPIRYIK